MPLKKSNLCITKIGAALVVLFLSMAAQVASAAPCDIRPGSPPFIRHDLTASYCELCGYGYVTIIISNPYDGAEMTDMTIVEDLGTTGLIFDRNAPNALQVNGVSQGSDAFPDGSGSILTWDKDQIDELASLQPRQGNDYTTLTITFAVTRASDPEGLVEVTDRRIEAQLTFSTDPTCSTSSASTGRDTLDLREPDPDIDKWGRNIDASQGNWTSTVYGNVNDDIIWRIRVRNNGDADLQDLRFDDVMQGGNLQINYACPTYSDAFDIADNDGVDPGNTDCVERYNNNSADIDNDINDFDVDNPFGNPGNDASDLIDVHEGRAANIYLVGKILPAPDGSCTNHRTNTVDDVQWGCEADSPAGGISATSDGDRPGSDSATLYTQYRELRELTVERQLTGINTSQPVGSKGTMTITIRNRTGGSIKNIHLADLLPAEYVMDPTFPPAATMDPRYGTYPGMIDNITWDNPVADPLDNTAPEFTLTSDGCSSGPCDDTEHAIYADQRDMMRHGDVLTIVFRVVLIESDYYDRQANLDVNPEVHPGTDPTYKTPLDNTLTVEFDTFCNTDGHRILTFTGNGTARNGSPVDAFPEDLDIAIGAGVFILTNDPNQILTLPILLTNNGGHDAADYHTFVSLGSTMEVVNAPADCRPITVSGDPPQPDPWKVWISSPPPPIDPFGISSTAVVYECSGVPVAPGQTVTYSFDVIKTADPARILIDDLSLRADVVGEIVLSDGTPLTFPDPIVRPDGELDPSNNYSLDTTWSRVIGFNLKKNQLGECNENNPPTYDANGFEEVQIGEECTFRIESGGWFGFETPGFSYIAVQNIDVVDEVPDGQAYISSTRPYHDPADPNNTSTPLITGVTLGQNGDALNPLDEDWFDWRFNVDDAVRIEQADEWFRVDTTTRVLNKPVDDSQTPNFHAADSYNVLNSTFDATFRNDNTGTVEEYTLGSSTIGYPNEPIRRVDLRITEPHVIVVKEVCNESLYGTGPSCSNFVPLANDGDAYDSYIYRLTVTNQAASDGFTRAPAYDVTVTDVLDASDLAEVDLLGSDGLDNDGDGAVDEADEGTISDNTVKNGVPAELTFSHTHSDELLRIDPGQSMALFYRIDYDNDAAPLQTFTNTAEATYDSLAGEFGNQSDPQRSTSNIGGARFYTSQPASATVQIIPVLTQPKQIATLSNTPLAAGSDPQRVSVGEEIEYRLHTLLPVALLRNFIIRDELPAGLRCSEAPEINLSEEPYDDAGFDPGGPVTPTCSGNVVEWNFGDQRVTNGNVGNRYDFEIGFIARVDNTAAVNDGDVLSNGDPATAATASYIDEANNSVVLDFGQVDVVVREPAIALTKAFNVVNADAGDILTVTVTAENTGTATAYNLRVLDDLRGSKLRYAGNTSGTDPPDILDSLGDNQPVFGWNRPIAPGDIIEFTFDVLVEVAAQPHEILDNTVQADWTSLPGYKTALNSSGEIGDDGSETGMRIGALPNAGDAVNDYETEASAQTEVPAAILSKTDFDPALTPAIGTHKAFQIDIRLPEGTTNGVIAADSLDSGGVSYVLTRNTDFDVTYTFEGIAVINGSTAVEEADFNAFPADGAEGSIVWDIGTVVTNTENDLSTSAIAPLIRIIYYARINNDMDTDSGDSLQNSVALDYTDGETGGTQTLTDVTPAVIAVEPALAAVKTVSNVTPGKQPADPPSGGDLLEYEVTILNSGTATARDVNVVDTLPPELSLQAGFTPTATVNGAAVDGFVATPAGAPAGPLVWGRDNGDDSLDIPVGQSLVLTYQTVVQQFGVDLSNRVWVDWSSLDAASVYERTGQGCPNWTAPNDYCIGPVVATTATVDTNAVDKAVSADTFDTPPFSSSVDAVARVGDIITYRLALNLSGGLTRNLRVQDLLPGGMAFADIVSINGDADADYTPPPSGPGSNFAYAPITAANVPTAGQTGTLTFTIGSVVNDPFGDPSTDTLEIIYRARILPDAGLAQVASTTLTNIVNMDYDSAAGPAPTRTDSADVTLLQPELTVSKSAVAGGGDSELAAGEIVTYTIEIANNGGGPAYDAVLIDIIPAGMRNGAATITVIGVQLVSGGPLPILAPVYDAATGLANWDFDTGTADQYTIPAGDSLRIVYQVQAETTLGAGLTLINQAQVQRYYSFDDDNVPTQGGVTGQRETYGPSNVATATFTTAIPDALTKDNPAVAAAAVGEPFTYRVTVPATAQETALHDVRILDDLGASAADLLFVSVAKISGSQPWTPVNTGTATNLVIEDTTAGIDIPAGEQVVIDITVVLEDTPTNVSGLPFNNTAAYTYDSIDNDPTTQSAGGSDTTGPMTIVGPDTLTLEKSGPATMQVGTPAIFVLDLHNTGSGTAWNPTIVDRLPDEAAGGLCGAGPSNVSAWIFEDDRTTLVAGPLVAGTDFAVEFDGAPTCEWRFRLLSAAGGLPFNRRLIVSYELQLDPDTENAIILTNVAGITRWYSADPDASGTAPRTYDRLLTDGTPAILDHEDAYTVNTQAPVLSFLMSVENMTTGQNPGSDASPGDTLRYTIQINNSGPVGLPSFSLTDELDRLNATPAFTAGSLNLVSVPPGADTLGTDPAGGTHGTGLLNVADLNVGAQGQADDTVTVVFDTTLAPVISSGTMVLGQAELSTANPVSLYSDDPNLAGDEDPTETLIASAPDFAVLKTSTDLSGDPDVLMAGETLRYTITIQNIGDEDAVDVSLRDYTPAHTTYVANSTTLNGNTMADPVASVSPLETGMPVHAPENTTSGYLRADAAPGGTNVATVTFDVVVDPSAMDGLVIENQGFVSGSGIGSGPQPERPSDDPSTPVPDDPTRNVVGNLPLLYAHKTVQILTDLGSPGIVDPGDVLRYSVVINNFGAIPATGVVLTDAVPPNTTYVAESLRLNGASPGPDGGVLPLVAGLPVQSSDNPGPGIISVGNSAGITFDVQVNAGVPTGTLIRNQGSVASNELPPELTDADGLPSNGDQPTIVVVGDVQLLSITKQIQVVGGGVATAGGQLEYVIRAVNIGSLPATRVVVTDDLSPPLGNQVAYVTGSGTLNGSAAGVTYAGNLLSADYGAQYGDLLPGGSVVVRFRVQIDPALAIGTTIVNTGEVRWNDPAQTAAASVSIDVGGTPGSAALNGNVWHDASLDKVFDAGSETAMQGWSVALYRNGQQIATAVTGAGGSYRLDGLLPNEGTADLYELRFTAPGAGPNTASLGTADSPFTNGLQRISAITVASGGNLQNLNLPLWPNGAVYDSVARVPVAGARLALLNAGTEVAVPSGCFDDPNQQNQVTTANGFYKFDLNFSGGACPAGGAYLIDVTAPTSGYLAAPSLIIPPASDVTTPPFDIPACPGSASDAVPGTAEYCEATTFPAVPPISIPPDTAGTRYYLHLVLNNGLLPGHSQVFNNPVPLDPELGAAVAIAKTSSKINVTRGELVPYTITVTNVFGAPLYNIRIVDRFPAGFKYVARSARLDGNPVEPKVDGRQLVWDGLQLQVNQRITLQLLLVVGSGVSEGEYVNRAQVLDTAIGSAVSGEATATVRVMPDPDFDCTDVIGKVFDDRNLNGGQDSGESGLAGVRVVTVRGLIATTDQHGRFHITCAAVPDEDRGSNFILKLDERSLPTGFRITTENPRVQRATRGKMIRFNFGATIHRVVRIDIAGGIFEPNTSELRLQWRPRVDRLLAELKKAPSVLRLSYLADIEREGLVRKRLNALRKEISRQWKQSDGGYRLTIETEIFWRRGTPLAGQR